jgi:hypothetical protein
VQVLIYALLGTCKFAMTREGVHRALRRVRQRLARGHDGRAGAVRASGDDAAALALGLHDLDA